VTTEYRCPHCDAVLTEVVKTQIVSVGEIAGKRRGPYKLSPEYLDEVHRVAASGGVPAVKERWHVSERTARRWLAAANEAGS